MASAGPGQKEKILMADVVRVSEDVLAEAVGAYLRSAGVGDMDVASTIRALMHASRIGVDSHGVRLAPYYVAEIRKGRMNVDPKRVLTQGGLCTALLDADHGLAHGASYMAVNEAISRARNFGVGAVGVCNSTHFGAAGAYAIEAAMQGMIGFATCNAESLVKLFGGKYAFHGTNPLAFAAPVPGGGLPWLMDMATSSVPFNRVLLYRSLGTSLPYGVAVDREGVQTCEANDAVCLQPLGGPDFGFKGAALAGMATVLSAVLTGAAMDPDIASDIAAEHGHGRANIGHFFLVLNPEYFIGRTGYEAAMERYLSAVRGAVPMDDGSSIMVPGDREWREAEHRRELGIPVDPDTARALSL